MQKISIVAGLMIALVSAASANGVIVYPSQGQSPEQQAKDEGACTGWASGQTGFDPAAPAPVEPPPPPRRKARGGAGRGLLKGALIGTAVGAISGDTGKGAAIGAGSGMLIGGVRKQNQDDRIERRQDNWAQQQENQYRQARNAFDRAFATCMQGNGYTVN